MTPKLFFSLYKLSHRLPPRFARSAGASLQAHMRRQHCAHQSHAAFGGNYCLFGCGTLLNPHAWRHYTVILASGAAEHVIAIGDDHARCLVEFGQSSPGQVDTAAQLAARHRVHPDNIVRCIAGQVARPADRNSSARLRVAAED